MLGPLVSLSGGLDLHKIVTYSQLVSTTSTSATDIATKTFTLSEDEFYKYKYLYIHVYNDFVEGYCTEGSTASKFYKDSQFQTEITGIDGKGYVNLTSGRYYIYSSSNQTYTRLGNSNARQFFLYSENFIPQKALTSIIRFGKRRTITTPPDRTIQASDGLLSMGVWATSITKTTNSLDNTKLDIQFTIQGRANTSSSSAYYGDIKGTYIIDVYGLLKKESDDK